MPTFSDSSFAEIYLVEETTWGEIPTGPPTLQTMRVTGESLGQGTTMESSQEIRADRQIPSLIRTDVTGSGDINFEAAYSAGLNDYLLKGAFMSDWSTADTITASDISFVAGTQIDTVAGDFTIFEDQQWIRVDGSTSNDGFYQINGAPAMLSITTYQATVLETAGASITIDNDGMMRNGTTKRSYVIEKNLTDVTEFISFTGMRVGSFGLNVAPGAIITGSSSFQGKGGAAAGATVGDGSPTAAGSEAVMSSIDDVYAIREGGAASTLSFTNLSFTLDNALRNQPAIGTLGPAGIGVGRVSITGQLEAYFENRTFYDKYLNFTSSDIDFRLSDGSVEPANSLIFTIPKVQFSDGQVVAGGIDQDILVSMSFESYLDSVGKMVQVDRFASS